MALELNQNDLIAVRFDIAEVIGVDGDGQVVAMYHDANGRSYEVLFKPEDVCDLVKIETVTELEE
jgi:hypothetical protein